MRLVTPSSRQFVVAVMLAATVGSVCGKEAVPLAADPEVEKKTMEISHELRCLVCQNQTIADSSAPLAVDLRREVREMVKQGKGQAEIVEYMEDRYGDFVRYMPAFKASTAALWIGPFVLMLGAVTLMLFNLARRRKTVDERSPLSQEEEQRVAALLGSDSSPENKNS